MVIEIKLKFLVRIVDAELLKAVVLEHFKAKNIQHANGIALKETEIMYQFNPSAPIFHANVTMPFEYLTYCRKMMHISHSRDQKQLRCPKIIQQIFPIQEGKFLHLTALCVAKDATKAASNHVATYKKSDFWTGTFRVNSHGRPEQNIVLKQQVQITFYFTIYEIENGHPCFCR